MSETETVRACPYGHIAVRRNSELRDGGFNGRPAKTEFYCTSCANKHSGEYRNPHYEQHELITKERKVNPDLEYDRNLGYVWSPSHDD